MEKFTLITDLIVIQLALLQWITFNGANASENTRWFSDRSVEHDPSRLCSDIILVTRKILENDVLRDLIYPKIVLEDGVFGKASKVIETRAQSKRTKIHFPSQPFKPSRRPPSASSVTKNEPQNVRKTRPENKNVRPVLQPSFERNKQQRPKRPQQPLAANKPVHDGSGLILASIHAKRNHQSPVKAMSPRLVDTSRHFMKRQDDSDDATTVERKDPNVVKKTFGYKVTLYKSPDSKEPPIMTEEFFGDGKKKKVIKILSKANSNDEPSKQDQLLSQQTTSSNGLYAPHRIKFVQHDETSGEGEKSQDEIESSRKILAALKKHLHRASEKAIEASKNVQKSNHEKQHDKKGAKEKALREKTQIEFFEREKIFANDENKGNLKEPRKIVMEMTTERPITKQPERDLIPIEEPGETDFQNLHDLLLKRLKGWREKGYKITTELEIVQKGAVHDKARSLKKQGKGEQSLNQFSSGTQNLKKAGFYVNSGSKRNTDDKSEITDETDEKSASVLEELPEFLLDSSDYEQDSKDEKRGRTQETVTKLSQPPEAPKALKSIKIVAPLAPVNQTKPRRGRKYSFKGMTRNPSNTKARNNPSTNDDSSNSGTRTISPTTPISILSNSQLTKSSKSPKKSTSNQFKKPPRVENYYEPPVTVAPQAGRLFKSSPMSFQSHLLYPPQPLLPGHPNNPADELANPLGFSNVLEDGMYFADPDGGFNQVTFGNPTLISFSSEHGFQPSLNPYLGSTEFLGFGGHFLNGPNRGLSQNLQNYRIIEERRKNRPSPVAFEEPPTRTVNGMLGKNQHQEDVTSTPGSVKYTKKGHQPRVKLHHRDLPTSIQDITRGKGVSSYSIEPEPVNIPPSLGLKAGGGIPKLSDFGTWADDFKGFSDDSALVYGNGFPKGLTGNLKSLSHFVPPKNVDSDWGSFTESPGIPNKFNGFPAEDQVGKAKSARKGSTIVRYTTRRPRKQSVQQPPQILSPAKARPTKRRNPSYDRLVQWDYTDSLETTPSPRKSVRTRPTRRSKVAKMESLFTVGFDSKRLRSPKSQDLLTRSSQIYPLIGGYSPFIIPSMDDDEDLNEKRNPDDDQESGGPANLDSIDEANNDDQGDDQSLNREESFEKAETWSEPCSSCP